MSPPVRPADAGDAGQVALPASADNLPVVRSGSSRPTPPATTSGSASTTSRSRAARAAAAPFVWRPHTADRRAPMSRRPRRRHLRSASPWLVTATSFSIESPQRPALLHPLRRGRPRTRSTRPPISRSTKTCTVTVDDTAVERSRTPTIRRTRWPRTSLQSFTAVPSSSVYRSRARLTLSPFAGRTSRDRRGHADAANSLTLQDAVGDGNVATSDAILVFAPASADRSPSATRSRSAASSREFRPGGAASTNLTTTEITSPTVTPAGPVR